MGAKRKPARPVRRRTWSAKPANAVSREGLQAAMTALYSDAPGPSVEDGLAQREQWRREDEARRAAQGCLPLWPKA